MGLSNHALIGLMFLALVGLGSAFPSDQEQKDETANEDLMRPAYFDYDEASVIILCFFYKWDFTKYLGCKNLILLF